MKLKKYDAEGLYLMYIDILNYAERNLKGVTQIEELMKFPIFLSKESLCRSFLRHNNRSDVWVYHIINAKICPCIILDGKAGSKTIKKSVRKKFIEKGKLLIKQRVRNSYNNDIAHCVGTDCPLKEKCRRFQLYKIWKEKKKKEWHTSFVEPRYSNGECENLIEI